MKKIIFLSKSLIILSMVLSLGFTSCKKGWWGDEDGPGKGGNNGGGKGEVIKGTIIKLDCGKSYYGNNYWIRTDNGELLQPCNQSFVTFCAIMLKEGDKVELKYSKYYGSIKDYEIYCKSNFAFTRVTIDFINVIESKTSCSAIILPNNYDKLIEAGVNISDAQIVGSSLVLKVGFGGCDNTTKRFKLIGKLLPTGGPIPTYEVKIVDDETQACKAYFTNELCFDLSSIKDPVSSSVISINIVGFEKVLQF